MSYYFFTQFVSKLSLEEWTLFFIPILLVLFALMALLISSFYGKKNKMQATNLAFIISVLGLVFALVCHHKIFIPLGVNLPMALVITPSELSKNIHYISLFGSLFSMLLIYRQDKWFSFLPEIYPLILLGQVGIYFLLFSQHLLFLYIALEVLSLSLYVIVSLKRSSKRASEAGVKYFILGSLASCFLLYGSALLFGATGSFDLVTIASSLTLESSSPKYFLGLVGSIFVLAGLLFKVGGVPFHSWVPDIYQGAPSSISAWMSSVVKTISFLLFIKVASLLFFKIPQSLLLKNVILLAGIISMFWGNIMIFSQQSLKRMLSYSSIAHTGYILIGVYSLQSLGQGFSEDSLGPLVSYLIFYFIASLLSFGIISYWEKILNKDISISDLPLIGQLSKVSTALFSVALFTLAGIPLTAGFVGKLFLISEGIKAQSYLPVVLLVLASLIGIYYYILCFYDAYFQPVKIEQSHKELFAKTENNFYQSIDFVFYGILAFLILLLGIIPQLLTNQL